MVKLTSSDGHQLDAHIARPAGTPRGGVVVVQEMNGVNDYLRTVCEFYAAHGYMTIAPSLYDRRQPGLIFDYTKEDHDRAQQVYKNWNFDLALADMDAARDAVASAGRVGVVGFCWGGTLSWLAACWRDYACAVPY